MNHAIIKPVAWAIILFTCNTAFAVSVIRGTIKNTTDGTINSYSYTEHIIERSVIKRDVKLVNDQLEIRIDNVDPVIVRFEFDHQMLDFFLLPDDSISFACDAKDMGNSLEINCSNHDDQVFTTSMSLIESLRLKGMGPYEVKGVGWQGLPKGLRDSLEREIKKQQDTYKSNKAGKLHFSAALRQRIIDTTYQRASQVMTLYGYQSFGNMKLKEEISESDIEALIANTEIENEDLLQNAAYITFLYWYDSRAYKQYREDNGLTFTSLRDWSMERFAFQDKLYRSPKVRYAVQTHVFCKNNINNPELFTEGAAKLNQMYPEGIYSEQLKKMSLSAKGLRSGQPAPQFTLKDIDGNMVSLESLKGKVLYIDFWATWCIPCVAENQAAKKIKPYYQDKDVMFIYITRDNNEAAWKKDVTEQQIEGLHLFGGGTAVFDQYQADGIPKYVLIDKEGKIVTADAPRPSDADKLKELIAPLL